MSHEHGWVSTGSTGGRYRCEEGKPAPCFALGHKFHLGELGAQIRPYSCKAAGCGAPAVGVNQHYGVRRFFVDARLATRTDVSAQFDYSGWEGCTSAVAH